MRRLITIFVERDYDILIYCFRCLNMAAKVSTDRKSVVNMQTFFQRRLRLHIVDALPLLRPPPPRPHVKMQMNRS